MSRVGSISVVPGRQNALGYQQITLSALSSLIVPAGAIIADIDAEAQNVRWTDDGSVPTSTKGKRLLADTERRFTDNLAALQFVAETAGAIINVTYLG